MKKKPALTSQPLNTFTEKEAPLPDAWPGRVKKSVLNAISLAHWSLIYARGWAMNSVDPRVRARAELEQANDRNAKLIEELRIKDAWIRRVRRIKRYRYSPDLRMRILELKASCGWSKRDAARRFHCAASTVTDWDKQSKTGSGLVRLAEPVNKYPDFVGIAVRRIKALSPTMGKSRIAKLMARAGWHMGVTTVGRMLDEKSRLNPKDVGPGGGRGRAKDDVGADGNSRAEPPPTTERATTTRGAAEASREATAGSGANGESAVEAKKDLKAAKIMSRHPNHTWLVDLTLVPTGLGMWVAWSPFALPQRWPFCWWVAVAIDHYSRRALGVTAFKGPPRAGDVCAFLGRLIRAVSETPKYIISDQGSQFTSEAYDEWCDRKEIAPRFGAVGRYGSIAIMERFIRSMKDECTRLILIPLRREEMIRELRLYLRWYNERRPHTYLVGATPEEAFRLRMPKHRAFRHEPRKAYPRPGRCAGPPAPLKGKQGQRLSLRVTYLEGRRHLPIVELVADAA